MRAWYLVIDVGKMGNKDERVVEIVNKVRARREPVSELEFIDGSRRESASRK